MWQFISILQSCTIYDEFNPILTITDPYTQPAMYLAYTISYNDWLNGAQVYRYVSMDVPAGQTEIYVTLYGDVHELCEDPTNNIVAMHDVAKVLDIAEFSSLTLSSPFVVFTHPDYRRCYLSDTNGIGADKFMEITPDLNSYLLDISLTADLSGYDFDFDSCETRVYMNMTPADGTMESDTNSLCLTKSCSSTTQTTETSYFRLFTSTQQQRTTMAFFPLQRIQLMERTIRF
ncbi:Hypothetical_protein [Hexamita inflata]|uniref:Hypothetical_protein n=1 Tax=Hexamita inflata TaxID=28002 RepID=A0AA86V0D8_9EUKA|nr:Hypothetical protein HINF_LOCUS59191 [Hexamita inflata]